MILNIEANLAQAVVNYLATRPYREVAELIQKLVALTPAQIDVSADGHSESMRECLAQLIRSDQLRHEDVQQIMSDAVFAEWYRKKYPESA